MIFKPTTTKLFQHRSLWGWPTAAHPCYNLLSPEFGGLPLQIKGKGWLQPLFPLTPTTDPRVGFLGLTLCTVVHLYLTLVPLNQQMQLLLDCLQPLVLH